MLGTFETSHKMDQVPQTVMAVGPVNTLDQSQQSAKFRQTSLSISSDFSRPVQ